MIFLERFRWTTYPPAIYASLYYESKREGADMYYRFQVVIEPLTSPRYYGFNILTGITVDSVTVTSAYVLKNASPNRWSNNIVYTSPWAKVANKTSGTTYNRIRIYSTQDQQGESITKEYNLPIISYATSKGNIKINGSYREAKPYVKINGSWKETKKTYVKVSGTWKETR